MEEGEHGADGQVQDGRELQHVRRHRQEEQVLPRRHRWPGHHRRQPHPHPRAPVADHALPHAEHPQVACREWRGRGREVHDIMGQRQGGQVREEVKDGQLQGQQPQDQCVLHRSPRRHRASSCEPGARPAGQDRGGADAERQVRDRGVPQAGHVHLLRVGGPGPGQAQDAPHPHRRHHVLRPCQAHIATQNKRNLTQPMRTTSSTIFHTFGCLPAAAPLSARSLSAPITHKLWPCSLACQRAMCAVISSSERTQLDGACVAEPRSSLVLYQLSLSTSQTVYSVAALVSSGHLPPSSH
mmetsp:Transcript_16861/g.29200  ORF Transcript_16861/g.29200 Transcript_16861/m.29200 type:complete len:297 (-) Transcript_16861:34-924(-)